MIPARGVDSRNEPPAPPEVVRFVRPAESRFSNSPLSGPNTEKPRRSHFFFTVSAKAVVRWGEELTEHEKPASANLNRPGQSPWLSTTQH